jgi:hypothetical protein
MITKEDALVAFTTIALATQPLFKPEEQYPHAHNVHEREQISPMSGVKVYGDLRRSDMDNKLYEVLSSQARLVIMPSEK